MDIDFVVTWLDSNDPKWQEEFRKYKGITTTAADLFIKEVSARYGMKSIGAFTYSDNMGSVRVLEKNGFLLQEEFLEDGRFSRYYQYENED